MSAPSILKKASATPSEKKKTVQFNEKITQATPIEIEDETAIEEGIERSFEVTEDALKEAVETKTKHRVIDDIQRAVERNITLDQYVTNKQINAHQSEEEALKTRTGIFYTQDQAHNVAQQFAAEDKDAKKGLIHAMTLKSRTPDSPDYCKYHLDEEEPNGPIKNTGKRPSLNFVQFVEVDDSEMDFGSDDDGVKVEDEMNASHYPDQNAAFIMEEDEYVSIEEDNSNKPSANNSNDELDILDFIPAATPKTSFWGKMVSRIFHGNSNANDHELNQSIHGDDARIPGKILSKPTSKKNNNNQDNQI